MTDSNELIEKYISGGGHRPSGNKPLGPPPPGRRPRLDPKDKVAPRKRLGPVPKGKRPRPAKRGAKRATRLVRKYSNESIEKANPNHDKLGRFASGGAAASSYSGGSRRTTDGMPAPSNMGPKQRQDYDQLNDAGKEAYHAAIKGGAKHREAFSTGIQIRNQTSTRKAGKTDPGASKKGHDGAKLTKQKGYTDSFDVVAGGQRIGSVYTSSGGRYYVGSQAGGGKNMHHNSQVGQDEGNNPNIVRFPHTPAGKAAAKKFVTHNDKSGGAWEVV